MTTKKDFSFNPPRGMRDFYPADMSVRNTIFDAWKTSARLFGFEEYDSCAVESLDLLKRKSGEDIMGQIYAFRDKSGRELALRPEITPTLARMVAARYESLSFPLKWFAIAQCFRYERMTRGRKREHYQWNLDIVGEKSVSAEAEIIASAVHALSILGLDKDDFCVHFSSRSLLADLFKKLGIPDDHHSSMFLALDKHGKLDDDKLREMFHESGLNAKSTDQIFTLLNISSLDETASIIGTDAASQRNVTEFMETLGAYGIGDMVKFDISVVRGLAYYTGIVFEAFDINRNFRAIFGGGRYDNLLTEIGGKSATGVGLGFGDVVIAEILAERKISAIETRRVDMAVGYMQEEQRATAISVAMSMRKAGKTTDIALKNEKAKSFFSRAGKSGFREAVYVGPDDVANGTVRIKNLETRTEQEIRLEEIGK